MGEKGNWTSEGGAPATAGAKGLVPPSDAKNSVTSFDAKGVDSLAGSKELGSDAGKGLEVPSTGTGSAPPFPGDGDRAATGLPPIGGLLRRSDGDDTPDTGPRA